VSQAKELYDLQQIDLDIDKASTTLRQIEVQLSDDSQLVQAKAKLEQEQAQLQDLQKNQRALERDSDDLRAKQAPLKQKLYGGSVKNPKELVSLQHEVDFLSDKITEKEDRALELMDEIEISQGTLAKITQEIEEVERQLKERKSSLLQEKSEAEKQLVSSTSARDALAASLDPGDLELYEYLRRGRTGTAVARVEQGRCQGCRITLPMNKLHKVRARHGVVQCDSCERILFVE
jgi:predicted  nucleic acid-binding Zn-ribbon protein